MTDNGSNVVGQATGSNPYTYTISNVTANHAVVATFAATPSATCSATVSSDHWQGEYFSNISLSGLPAMVLDDGAVFLNFDWGVTSPGISCGIPIDNFSVRWTRTLYFDAGSYEFTVTADDGVRLYVDNTLVIDKWIDQAATTYKTMVPMAAGSHTIKLEYYEHGGAAVAKLSWQVMG